MSLRSRLLLAFLIPALLVLSLGGWGLYHFSQLTLEEELGRSLSEIAAAISSQLKAERVLALEPEDAQGEGSRTFRSLHAQLLELRAQTGLRRILVVDAQLRARLDVGGPLVPHMEAHELFKDSLETKAALSGTRAFSQVLFEGHDGRLYKTGYAPLLANEEVVGLVAVEGAAEFFGPLLQLRNAIAALAAVTLALLALAAVLSALSIARPMERLVSAAVRIGAGDLSTPVRKERSLEIGVLARKLDAMREALESRDRQLKTMLGGVAHEVKNPLGGMELFSGLLAEELSSNTLDVEQARAHTGKIQRELSYLKRIVDDFLAFAREQKLQRSEVDAAHLVHTAAQLLAAEAQAQNIALHVEATSARLVCDESLVTSALVNLAKNALQASGPGQRVTLRGINAHGRYRFEVEDEGAGIRSELQRRIFEPFFTTKQQGSGLGLPLAQKLFEAHGGTLRVDSRPGRTIFEGEIPLDYSK